MEQQMSLLLISGDSNTYTPEFRRLLQIAHVLCRGGYSIANLHGHILNGEARLDPRSARCFVVGEDPNDRPGRICRLLRLAGMSKPRHRVIRMQIIMRNEKEAWLTYYELNQVEEACQIANLIARTLKITVQPSCDKNDQLAKTIGVGTTPS